MTPQSVELQTQANLTRQPRWRFWTGAGVILTAAALFAAFSLGHMQIVASTIGMEQYLGEGDRLPAALLMTSQLLKAAALMLAVWALLVFRKERGWASLGLVSVKPFWLIAGIVMGVLFVPAGVVITKTVVALMPGWSGFTHSAFAFGDSIHWSTRAGFLVLTLALTPFVEEVFFRGFMFQWMAGHRPLWVAAIMSSVIFGVMHILPPQAINAALLSLALILIFRASGSLWPAIIAHATNNTLGIVLGSMAAEGRLPVWLTPPG